MKSLKSKYEQFLVVFVLAFTACTTQKAADISSTECIGSFQKFAYTVPDNELPYLSTKTLPLFPWQVEVILPPTTSETTIEATRKVNDTFEIWIGVQTYEGSYRKLDAKSYYYLVYQEYNKEWEVISAQVENSEVSVDRIYVDPEGFIWGRNVWDISSTSNTYTILSKFNEETKRFSFVNSVQGIPVFWRDSDPRTVDLPLWTEILLDKSGTFWLLAHKDAIYSYSPATQEIKRFVEIPNYLVKQAVLAPDGSIYFQKYDEYNTGFSLEYQQLFQFLPNDGKIEPLDTPHKRWPGFGNILADHTGKLWLDTVGWHEPDGTWRMIYPNPWLYFWKMEWEEDYRWATPHIILESSNGYLWYSSEKGMAWLDPDLMQGCWFTTYQSNIVEDSDHNLWMIADGKLHKLSLNK